MTSTTTTTTKTQEAHIMSNPRVGNSSTNQACAACKYQRRKCAPDCILAPYFPHHRQRQFQNAHKLFGVSNITKIIRNLKPPEKEEAMRTIIFQSDARANDPVGGCYRIIRNLQRQIEFSKAELDLVLHQLALCRGQAQNVQPSHHHFQMQDTDSAMLVSEIVDADPSEMYDPAMQYHYEQSHQQNQECLVRDNNCHMQEDVCAWTGQESSMSLSSSLHVKQPHYANECDDMKTMIDINDVKFEPEELIRRSFVPTTELVISS